MSSSATRDYWNGPAGEKWVRNLPRTDYALGPLTEALLAVACVREGERAIDVGCGCGTTVLLLAQQLGANGLVHGVDVSEPMFELARERTAELSNVRLTLGDAASVPFEEQSFDLVFSRLGVMFFEDPTAAFTHLRGALAPGGRITFACFRSLEENAWATVPLAVAARLGCTPAPAADPDGPGPFALADAGRVRRVLADAGFSSVQAHPVDVPLLVGTGIDDAVDYLLTFGPAAQLLRDLDAREAEQARQLLREELAPRRYASGVALGAAAWIFTARRW